MKTCKNCNLNHVVIIKVLNNIHKYLLLKHFKKMTFGVKIKNFTDIEYEQKEADFINKSDRKKVILFVVTSNKYKKE